MSVRMEVWGDYACFTRPEFGTERVSYDVMTPSAAIGMLEAVFWHPGLIYEIKKIYVCNPVKTLNVRRTEIKHLFSASSAMSVMMGKSDAPILLDANLETQLRATMLLKDVHYVIEAELKLDKNECHEGDSIPKFLSMLERRMAKGQHYHAPCFGVRECPAHFKLCEKLPPCPEELKGTIDLSYMLHSMDYTDPQNPKPRFFRAKLVDGVMEVPTLESGEVLY